MELAGAVESLLEKRLRHGNFALLIKLIVDQGPAHGLLIDLYVRKQIQRRLACLSGSELFDLLT